MIHALNALVFFYRDVCGRQKIDLQVKLRKSSPRQLVILRRVALMGLREKNELRCKTAALLPDGAGLRLGECHECSVAECDHGAGARHQRLIFIKVASF